jgi:hypothetical protein
MMSTQRLHWHPSHLIDQGQRGTLATMFNTFGTCRTSRSKATREFHVVFSSASYSTTPRSLNRAIKLKIQGIMSGALKLT